MLARIASLALMGLLALAGCTDDTDARGEGPTSDPPVSTSTPVEPVTSEPTSATTETETADPSAETPKEFIRRFQAEAYAMQRSGDTTGYRGLTYFCGSCDNLADAVDEIYADGGTASVGGGQVSDIELVGTVKATQIYEYRLVSEPGEVRDASGKVVQSFDGGEASYQINLRRSPPDSGWLVTELSQLS